MRRSEGRPGRVRGAGRSAATGEVPSQRAARRVLGAGAATLATAVGVSAAVVGSPVLAASLAVAALAFAACWLGALGAAHLLARLLARR